LRARARLHLARVEAAEKGFAVNARELVRRFGDVLALDHVSLDIARGEFFSLLGPSGCGKTTFLRIIAGLDSPDEGTLAIGGKDALPIPPHRRAVNTVFQSYALFPHMTVEENIAFGLKMKKIARTEIATRVKRALDLAQIAELAERKPHQISGGQKQRVALARALINEPEVLLLDEPLGALDVKLRRELQQELHALQRRLGITFVHVTHDQDEALSLSDRIAVMNAGKVIQAGDATEIYHRPRNRFVAQFVGGCNLIEVTRIDERTARAGFGRIEIASRWEGNKLTLALRPERVLIGERADVNGFDARVIETTFTGAETHALLDVNGFLLRAVALNAAGAPRLQAGEIVAVSLPAEAMHALED
jgi:spermidine/putrescine transport system ATP-binding protein